MPLAWCALHLPALLSHLLRLLLPSRPFPAGIRTSPPAALRPQPKCTPARLRSFLEETPYRATVPKPSPPPAAVAEPHPVLSPPQTRIVADSSQRPAPRPTPTAGSLSAPRFTPHRFPPNDTPRPSRATRRSGRRRLWSAASRIQPENAPPRLKSFLERGLYRILART